jgi:hypothetical protein
MGVQVEQESYEMPPREGFTVLKRSADRCRRRYLSSGLALPKK